MKYVKEIKNVHLPNLAIFGVLPTIILYILAKDFNDFIRKVENYSTASPLLVYFAILFIVPAILRKIGFLNSTSKWTSIVKSMSETLRSIYYVLTGICLTTSVVLSPKVRSIAEAKVVLIALAASLFFLVGSFLFDHFLPHSLGLEE